ncbi:HDIG domain-containing metalloprotein [Desulfolithobacter sp.]
MAIPTLTQCYQLMERYRMLPNIRRHSIVVAKVAELLVDTLPPELELPDKKRVVAGALLHDIAKTPCLDNGCEHALLGAVLCEEHGFHEIAPCVAEHVLLKHHEPQRYARGHFLAREIVYYADKRVRHDQIVSLEERLDYIIQHYGNNDPLRHRLIQENFQKCIDLEQHLFQWLDFPPEAVPEIIVCGKEDLPT